MPYKGRNRKKTQIFDPATTNTVYYDNINNTVKNEPTMTTIDTKRNQNLGSLIKIRRNILRRPKITKGTHCLLTI